uniref:CSON002779 protein n=1 Tax=Culicoides sonorensis TaxID=179676 RepID=A0A336MR15_CULSO
MDIKLKQNPFMTSRTSNYFPVQRGYSIFGPNPLTQGHSQASSVIHRGFATSAPTTTANSLPYLKIVHSSPLLESSQGQNTQTEMGSLISIIGGLPLVGVVQKFFGNLFSSKDSPTNTTKPDQNPDVYEPVLLDLTTKENKSNESISNTTKLIQEKMFDQNCDNCGDDKSRNKIKRTQRESPMKQLNAEKHSIGHSPFNPHNFFHKPRVANKNRLEKQRHNIQCDIHEDLGIESDSDEEELLNENTHFGSFEICGSEISPKLTVIYKSSPETRSNNNNNNSPTTLVSKSFVFSLEDFPAMPENSCNYQSRTMKALAKASPKRNNGFYRRQDSVESPSEEDFVVYDKNSVNTTPCSGTGTSPSLRSLLISRLKCGGGRQRQISECSDDSVVILFESDGDQQLCDNWSDTEISEDDETEDEDENDPVDTNQQPDSGFEEKEKKVRFCLKPEVHEMWAWDFAYRQARIGPWERYGRDRERFRNRIWRTEQILAPIFDPDHRQKVIEERLNPNSIKEST